MECATKWVAPLIIKNVFPFRIHKEAPQQCTVPPHNNHHVAIFSTAVSSTSTSGPDTADAVDMSELQLHQIAIDGSGCLSKALASWASSCSMDHSFFSASLCCSSSNAFSAIHWNRCLMISKLSTALCNCTDSPLMCWSLLIRETFFSTMTLFAIVILNDTFAAVDQTNCEVLPHISSYLYKLRASFSYFSYIRSRDCDRYFFGFGRLVRY